MICRFLDVTCLHVEDDSAAQSSAPEEGCLTVLEAPKGRPESSSPAFWAAALASGAMGGC